jgi:acetamidase/formamidase
LAEKAREEDNFFVGIESPVELRRQLLEASKRMIEVLKRYETFKEKRARKLAYVEKLKKSISEIAKLNAKLKNIMPKTNLRVPRKILGIPEKALPKANVQEEKEPAS